MSLWYPYNFGEPADQDIYDLQNCRSFSLSSFKRHPDQDRHGSSSTGVLVAAVSRTVVRRWLQMSRRLNSTRLNCVSVTSNFCDCYFVTGFDARHFWDAPTFHYYSGSTSPGPQARDTSGQYRGIPPPFHPLCLNPFDNGGKQHKT